MENIKTREEWLIEAGKHTAGLIESVGVEVPEIYVSVGFPKGGGKKKIGQCWDIKASEAGVHHLFVCPTIGQDRVLDVLLHEQIHAAVGVDKKHKSPFSRVADQVGLLAPWTATTASEVLIGKFLGIVDKIGPYPHDRLTLPVRGKGPGSRYRLYECACLIKIRAARDDLKVFCEECSSQFVFKGADPEKDKDGGSKE